MGVEKILTHVPGQDWESLRLKATDLSTVEWPKIEGDLCWDSTTFGSDESFTLNLNDSDLAESKAALDHFKRLGLYGSDVSANTFPLSVLGPKLLQLANDVHFGRGFVVVRGLNPEDFSPEDNVLLFLGISSYIGAKRGRQDEDGNMLMHIRDAKLSKTPQSDRPTRYSSRASTFHTDTFCDILALHTRNCATEGGANLLASSWTLYNKLRVSRPDVLQLLSEPIWPFDSRGKFFDSTTRPLLFQQDGRIMMNFAREPLLGLEGVPRAAKLAVLTMAQREALDIVESIARESQIKLDAERGDMIFINNHAVLHSREAFSDSPGAPRHLVRAWLKNPELAWALPSALQQGSSRIYDDNELGERWNIVDTAPKIKFRLSERLTS